MVAQVNALDRLGTRAETNNPMDVIRAGGGDFGLTKEPLSRYIPGSNPDLFVVRRNDTGAAIGQVGSYYELFPNREIFEPVANALIQETGAEIQRFGMMDGGAKAFMRIAWPDDKNIRVGGPEVGDIVGRRATIVTSHDGTWAATLAFQMLRLICSNGMVMPVGNAKFKLYHTKGGHSKLADITKMIPQIDEYVRRFEVSAGILADTPVASTSPQARDIVVSVVDSGKKAGETKTGDDNAAERRISTVLDLFDHNQAGADNRAVKGTG